MKKSKRPRLHAPTIFKKYQNWDVLFKYEEEYLRKKLRKEADDTFSAYIRARDSDHAGYIKCVTCDRRVFWKGGKHTANACHWIGRDCYKYRWDEDNVYWGCAYCNARDKQRHQQMFTIFMTDKFGIEKVRQMKVDEDSINEVPDIEDLIAIIRKFKKKFLELKKIKTFI